MSERPSKQHRLRSPGAWLLAALALLWLRPLAEGERAVEADPGTPGTPAGGPPVAAVSARPQTAPAAEAVVLDRRAVDAWRSGDVRAAMELFERAIAAAPDDPAPHSHYGRLLTLMVAYERALPLLERARDLAPGDAQAWLDLATVYERAQRFEDAWAARAVAEELVGPDAITRDEQGRFVVVGSVL